MEIETTSNGMIKIITNDKDLKGFIRNNRKIILSRKGFDSKYGGMPSPILPDGTLLSMPIPHKNAIRYEELSWQGKTYKEILTELRPNFHEDSCHLDPDLRKNICERRDCMWKAAFGQSDSALTHLLNHNIKEGDIFLYFGWFKQTEFDSNNKLRFVKGAPDRHIIYGYLQIGEAITDNATISKYSWHPHASEEYTSKELNALFLASQHFLDTALLGYGTLPLMKELVLTKDGHPRTHWELPDCLKGKSISYHDADSQKEDYFQSAMIGQEFVADADNAVIDWLKDTILKANNIRINKFTQKWIAKFEDPTIDYKELVGRFLAEDCEEVGFNMDCGESFCRLYGSEAYNNVDILECIIEKIDQIDVLGAAIYSQWRYYNHWAYDGKEIMNPNILNWFIMILKRIKVLTQ